jgi:hypothetical protein
MTNRSVGSAPISRSLRALSKKGVREVAKQDIAPTGREHIGLALATCWRNDDLHLDHFMPPQGGSAWPPSPAISMSTGLRPYQFRVAYGEERPVQNVPPASASSAA